MTDYITKTVSTYEAGITLKKYIYELLILLAITGLTWVVDYLIPNLTLDYPEYAGILLVVAPLITALVNFIKHYKDTEIVRVDPATGIEISNDD